MRLSEMLFFTMNYAYFLAKLKSKHIFVQNTSFLQRITHTFSKTQVFTMKNTTLSKPALLGAGWAGSGHSATVSDFSHKPCLMGVLNCGCEQKGNERVERPPPANPGLERELGRELGRHVPASTKINETRAR